MGRCTVRLNCSTRPSIVEREGRVRVRWKGARERGAEWWRCRWRVPLFIVLFVMNGAHLRDSSSPSRSRSVISENLNYFRQKLRSSARTSSLMRPHSCSALTFIHHTPLYHIHNRGHRTTRN